ncbi:phage protease [Hansschlegelia zhihuaiae]|uniref:Uncharacterized protein n=1 Tax=Hansschlegelia zhihuaiae TaxID=405005 RepID=A0A4Q0MMW2_9HYPH|nr:phage protease [Hansschlegelia zhihuaiae]RXF75074.1 hypothetical protein EK403_03225 [Hansschlegelia zhihuaiae]
MSNAAATEIALCAALPLPAAGDAAHPKAPEFIHLVPAGDVATVDGRGPYRMPDAAKVAASFVSGSRLPICENHAIDYAAPKGGPSPARGWIVGLQARDDGLWGKVEWTAAGARLVTSKAYREISPALVHRKDGEVVGVARASLVNMANLRGLVALHSQQGHSMDLLPQLRQALGLAESADEAAVLAAVKGQAARVSTHAAIAAALGVDAGAATEVALQGVQAAGAKAVTEALKPINAALGLAADAAPAVALQAVQELRDPAKHVPAATVTALQSQLRELGESITKERATAFVDAAIKAGKPIVPLRDHYIARHMASPDEAKRVETEIGAMVSLQGARPRPTPKEGEPALSEVDDQVIALMGVDPKAFAAARKLEEEKRV